MRSHSVGSLREHLVAVDLLKRGFEVYVGSGHSSFDLVACKDGQCIRIEVKGSKRAGKSGPVTGSCSDCDHTRFDVLAGVDDNDQVYYRRSIVYDALSSPAWELVKDNEAYNKMTPHKIRARAEETIQ